MRTKLRIVTSLACVALCSFGNAQTKQIPIQQVSAGSGIFFGAEMNQSNSTITMTIQGPDDRWFAVGFGLSMGNADPLVYTDGKVGAMHTLDVWDYRLTAQSAAGVTKDAQQDWTINSNTTSGGVRTIVATRALNTGDAADHVLNYSDATINVIWAKSSNVDFTLAYHGSGNRGSLGLTWVEVDLTAPALVTNPFTPADDATGVTLASNLDMSFNENVSFGSGNITLKLSSDNTIVEQFDVASSGLLSISGTNITINPSNNLSPLTNYYVTVDNGAIQDGSGNPYGGFSDNATWNFTTLDNSGDVTAPSLAVGPFNPADGETNVILSTLLTVDFDEDVALANGNITLRETNGAAIVETFNVATSPNVAVNLTDVIITPSNVLNLNTAYFVEIDNGAIEDLAGNAFSGISDSTMWNFRTIATDAIGEIENSNFEVSISEEGMLVIHAKMDVPFEFEVIGTDGRAFRSGVSEQGEIHLSLLDLKSISFIIRIRSEFGIYVGTYAFVK